MSRTAVTVRTAPAFDASARREHGLLPVGMSSPAAACMPLHPAYRCPLFDSLQLSSGTPAAISATFGGEVAVVFFAGTLWQPPALLSSAL